VVGASFCAYLMLANFSGVFMGGREDGEEKV
jgi:hypothetical protein